MSLSPTIQQCKGANMLLWLHNFCDCAIVFPYTCKLIVRSWYLVWTAWQKVRVWPVVVARNRAQEISLFIICSFSFHDGNAFLLDILVSQEFQAFKIAKGRGCRSRRSQILIFQCSKLIVTSRLAFFSTYLILITNIS